MNEPTLDNVEYCCVCGSPIWSHESKMRGYGSECAKAIRTAQVKRVFADDELRKEYYGIESQLLISYMKNRNFRSDFRKSFQATVLKQATWMSKKQAEICRSILFDYDGDSFEVFDKELSRLKEAFWSKIQVTRTDIEIARRKLREEGKKIKIED